jgi:putative SOS response-associated peptidase YedK
VAGIIGLRGPDIEKRDALRGFQVEFRDADRPIIRPHTGCPVLRLVEGEPVVERHVFGFSKRFSSFNARTDRLGESRMWKGMFGKHHGVAPVSYVLEWADLGDGKRPYRIERTDGSAMAVPALVGTYWEDRSDRAFALVTVDANRFFATFHDRMVAQLDDEAIGVWLRPEEHAEEQLRECLVPGPDDGLVAHPLAAGVGAAKFNDANMLAAVGDPVSWQDLVAAHPQADRTRS